MSEPAATPPRMTVAEFMKWDDGTDTRYELVDGRVVAMSPAFEPHGRIAGNAFVEIDRRLESRSPCTGVVEGGIRLNDKDYNVADVAATCSPPSEDGYVAEPFLIVEVLSDSDRGKRAKEKVDDYIALPSVREIWLIDSRKRWVQQWWREGEDRWVVRLPMRGSATFASPTLGGEPVALDRLYRNTGL
jgi:Uma2 family endonuclease